MANVFSSDIKWQTPKEYKPCRHHDIVTVYHYEKGEVVNITWQCSYCERELVLK